MALARHDPGQLGPQLFRQLVVTNSRYWLSSIRRDPSHVLRETPQVLTALEYGLALPEAWEPSRDLTLTFSPLIIRQGHSRAWESLLRHSIERSSQEKDPAEIELCLQLGTLYRLQGRLPEARDCLQQGLASCDQYKLSTHEPALLNCLGLVSRLSGQHEEALTYSQQVLGKPELRATEQAEAFNVMGLVAFDRRQWPEALDHFEQALVLYRPSQSSYEIARILNNRGIAFLHSKQLDKAQASFEESILQFRAAGNHVELFKAIMNLGNVHLTKQAFEVAIQQYQEALPAFRSYGYGLDLANVYNNLGMAYSGLTDWSVAETFFTNSLDVSHNLGKSYNLANTLDNYGAMLIKANRLAQAKQILEQALKTLSVLPNSPGNSRLRGVVEERLAQLEVQ